MVKTVYVIPLGTDGGKIEFTHTGKGGVKVVITDPITTVTAIFPLSELVEVATNLEMDSTPEEEKK
jgi:hypothetical protein